MNRLSPGRRALASAIARLRKARRQSGSARPAPGLTIAVIPKGTTHNFWQSIHAGAEQARRRSSASTIIWRGPLREDDRDSQVSEVEGFVSRGVSGIVLAPLDESRAGAAGRRRGATARSRS